MDQPLITNDAVIFGILMLMLGAVFYTSSLDQPILEKILHLHSGFAGLLFPAFAIKSCWPN